MKEKKKKKKKKKRKKKKKKKGKKKEEKITCRISRQGLANVISVVNGPHIGNRWTSTATYKINHGQGAFLCGR